MSDLEIGDEIEITSIYSKRKGEHGRVLSEINDNKCTVMLHNEHIKRTFTRTSLKKVENYKENTRMGEKSKWSFKIRGGEQIDYSKIRDELSKEYPLIVWNINGVNYFKLHRSIYDKIELSNKTDYLTNRLFKYLYSDFGFDLKWDRTIKDVIDFIKEVRESKYADEYSVEKEVNVVKIKV